LNESGPTPWLCGWEQKKQVSLSDEHSTRQQQKETGGFHCSVWLKHIGWEMMLCIIGMFFY
jgi:hypothetical protein